MFNIAIKEATHQRNDPIPMLDFGADVYGKYRVSTGRIGTSHIYFQKQAEGQINKLLTENPDKNEVAYSWVYTQVADPEDVIV